MVGGDDLTERFIWHFYFPPRYGRKTWHDCINSWVPLKSRGYPEEVGEWEVGGKRFLGQAKRLVNVRPCTMYYIYKSAFILSLPLTNDHSPNEH